MYQPNKWLIIKITGVDPHYKVFATWSGGYTTSDSWRMNSGIIKAYQEDEFIIFEGSSGSKYKCHKNSYGINIWGSNVLQQYIDRSEGKISIMDENHDWLNFDWIIKE